LDEFNDVVPDGDGELLDGGNAVSKEDVFPVRFLLIQVVFELEAPQFLAFDLLVGIRNVRSGSKFLGKRRGGGRGRRRGQQVFVHPGGNRRHGEPASPIRRREKFPARARQELPPKPPADGHLIDEAAPGVEPALEMGVDEVCDAIPTTHNGGGRGDRAGKREDGRTRGVFRRRAVRNRKARQIHTESLQKREPVKGRKQLHRLTREKRHWHKKSRSVCNSVNERQM